MLRYSFSTAKHEHMLSPAKGLPTLHTYRKTAGRYIPTTIPCLLDVFVRQLPHQSLLVRRAPCKTQSLQFTTWYISRPFDTLERKHKIKQAGAENARCSRTSPVIDLSPLCVPRLLRPRPKRPASTCSYADYCRATYSSKKP